jgi:hypothetical protein
MKHLQSFSLFEAQTSFLTTDQKEFLNECTKGAWSVNRQTGLVNVEGNFDCSFKSLKSLPDISFGHVSGHYGCFNNQLTSLEGAPQTVGGGFYCSNNKLISLEGSPQTVGGDFWCDEFELDSGKWNMQGWVEVLNTGTPAAQKLISTLPWIQPDWWNLELQRDPGKTVHLLATAWNHMPKDIQSAIKIPRGYEGDFELFSGFDELGLF